MEVKAIKSIFLIALACRIISSDHLLIDRSSGGAIPFGHNDRDGCRRGRSRGPRRRMSRCLAARLLRREISPRCRTLSTEDAPEPPEASDVRADDGCGPCVVSDGVEAAAPWSRCMTDFEGLNKRITRVATIQRKNYAMYLYLLRLAARAFVVFSTDPQFL